MNENKKVTYSIPLIPITILFVILKLAEAITWDWVWVLAPLWVPPASVLSVVALFLALAACAAVLKVVVAIPAAIFLEIESYFARRRARKAREERRQKWLNRS